MAVEAIGNPDRGMDRAARHGLFAGLSAAVCVLILAVSAWHMLTSGTHTDVSWLLTVGEKILSGEQLYVDIWENNPPASVYLYLPMAWLGSVTPLLAETWTVLATYVWVIGFGAFAFLLSERLDLTKGREGLVIVPAGLYVLVLFMPATFSQREHFALASALPMLVLAAWRMSGGKTGAVRLSWIVVGGLGAAFTMMIKPHYALVFLFPYLLAAFATRTPRLLWSPEVLVAAAATVAYGLLLWLVFPVYAAEIVPMMLDVYRLRRSLVELVFVNDWMQPVLAGLLILLMIMAARRRDNPLVWTFAAAAIGFFIAYLVMGKGWNYHAMPALSLTAMAIAIAGARWTATEMRRGGEMLASPVVVALVAAAGITSGGTNLAWERFDPPEELVRHIRTVVPHPVVASVSSNIGVGHPLARSVQGTWLERTCADWIAVWGSVTLRSDPAIDKARRERIENLVEKEIAYKIGTWTATPPDVVMLDPEPGGGDAVIGADPEFAKILSGYTVVYGDGWARVALRADLLPAWEAANATASSPGAASD